LGERISGDYDDDEYEEDDEVEPEVQPEVKPEALPEVVPSSTSRSSTTQPTTTTTATTAAVTAASPSTTASPESEEAAEDEPASPRPSAPFFPTRMTAADKTTKAAVAPTEAAAVGAAVKPAAEEDSDKSASLKDMLRSGKFGNDPTKIKELLKDLKKPDDAGADEDDLNAKDIFKKYADLAKNKPTEVHFHTDINFFGTYPSRNYVHS
jgi:hypothetical protein